MSTSIELAVAPQRDAEATGHWQELMAAWTGSGGPLPAAGVAIGEVVAVAREGSTPLVRLAGARGTAVLRARSVVDLQRQHVGRSVILAFEGSDPARPVVLGLLHGQPGWPLAQAPGQVEVDADGGRMFVSASRELVLRCGRASITLSASGHIVLDGVEILSRASGAHQIQGGTVDIN
jgi:hypothetical protein